MSATENGQPLGLGLGEGLGWRFRSYETGESHEPTRFVCD